MSWSFMADIWSQKLLRRKFVTKLWFSYSKMNAVSDETLIRSSYFTSFIQDKTYLRQGSLLGEVLADQQPGVSPLDIEVSVEGDAEVLVRHLGDVLDVHADGDEGGLGLQGQVVLLVVGWDADSLATPHCTDQVPPGVWWSTWSSTQVLWKATFRRN